MRRLFLLLALILPLRLMAQEQIVAGFSHDLIDITARFDGSEILIFGAVKRAGPVDETTPLGVIVTIEGPAEQVVVRRKSRRFGIWMNREKLWLTSVPSFYSVSTTWPVSLMLIPAEDDRYDITVDRLIRSFGEDEAREFAPEFVEALIRLRSQTGLYQLNEGQVQLEQSTLFQTRVQMPATLVEGDYATRIFLTRNGQVIDRYESRIGVYKVGLERSVHALAQDRPLVYGLLALGIAALAGWGASVVFRALRF